MSTKTTIKRIALVAVSALGLGVVTAVAPANASVSGTQVPIVATITNTTTTIAGRVGNPVSINISATLAGTADSTTASERPSLSFAAAFTSRPAGAAADQPTFSTTTAQAAAVDADLTYGSAATAASGTTAPDSVAGVAGTTTVPTVYTVHGDDGDDVAAVTTAATVGTVTFTPTFAGTYKLNVWNELSITGAASLNGTESYKTFTIIVGDGASTITLTKVTGDSVEDATYGAIIKVALTDAAGNVATLAAGEAITIDPSLSGTVYSRRAGATGTDSTTSAAAGAAYNLTSSDFSNGVAYINVTDLVAETSVITATYSANTSVTATTSVKFNEKSAGTATVAPKAETTGWVANTAPAYYVPWSSSVTFKVTGDAASLSGTYFGVTVRDTNGKITGLTDAYYDAPVALSVAAGTTGTASGYGYLTIAAAFTADSQSYSVSDALLAAGTTNISSTPNVMTSASVNIGASTINSEVAGDDTVSVANDNIRVAPAGTATFSVTVSNQFGGTISNARVIMSWTGRNTSTVNTQKTAYTNADGVATLSYTDTAASTVTASADTVTFTASDGTNSSTSTATVNWLATTVGTVTILGGNNTATGVAAQTAQYKDITAGDGAEGSKYTAVATVKDANGALLVGVPVTFTISGTGAAITSTTQTVYTGTAGTATANVYGWLAGTYTVTATAGGKTGTADFAFRQDTNSTAGEERAISVTAAGNIVTAKVVDRFGNPVPSVTVYATQAGGVTINSKTRDSGSTDSNGQIDFIVAGSGTVTVSTINWTAAAGSYGSGQTSAPKGYLYNSSSATTLATYAFTAYTAGTSTADEEGVGASYDAAGVSSATVDVATSGASDSVDAANEATDAANAATDAANAAAEAADAATAAAQDAQAAVAELATKVASLIAGIKAQITTLTNLVIKIQKKVRA